MIYNADALVTGRVFQHSSGMNVQKSVLGNTVILGINMYTCYSTNSVCNVKCSNIIAPSHGLAGYENKTHKITTIFRGTQTRPSLWQSFAHPSIVY